MVTVLHYRKSKLCTGHRFSNTVKIMLFISDISKLYTYKAMQSSRQYTFIQNYRHAKSIKYKAKQKLHMGYIRNRLERSHSDFLMKT